MVMRSVYLILGCCLMFAAVMVMGVSMQSCKSKRAMEKSVHVDSVGMSAYKEEMDSFAFRRLLERYNKNFSLEIRHYRPVKDTTFEVTGTYLEEHILFSHRHEKERDSSGWDVVLREKEDNTEATVSAESESEEEPASTDYKILFYSVLVILVFQWMKK